MEYLVAVSSRDGVMIHQHFGHTEEFLILEVEDNEKYRFVEKRPVTAPCHMGDHDEEQLSRTIDALSDCKYVLSAKIGMGAQAALQARGITPLEIAHFVDYAMTKVMLYDKKYKHDERTKTLCQKNN